MPEYDSIIKGGMIVDGTRMPRYRADIGIKNGIIAKIGKLRASDADKVLDASDLIVAPGAIDLHAHYDAPLHWDPHCSIGNWHGVTSVTMGNCGLGFAPLHAKDIDHSMRAMQLSEGIPYEAMKTSMSVNWETFPQWLNHIDDLPKSVNVVNLVPITPLVSFVMGGWTEAKSRPPNDREMGEIVRLFHEAMEAGANGWAAQRLIDADGGTSAQRDESVLVSDILPDAFYLTMAKALGSYDRGCAQVTQFTKGFDDPEEGAIHDIRFCGNLSELSNRPVLYNAIAMGSCHSPSSQKAASSFGRRSAYSRLVDQKVGLLDTQLRILAELNTKGIRLIGQGLTVRADFRFTLEDENLFDTVASWRAATNGTSEERKRKLSDPNVRQAMREEYDNSKQPSMFGDVADFIAAELGREELQAKYEGLSVAQIAEAEHKHIIDALLDLSVEDNLKTEWLTPVRKASAENAKRLLDYPYIAAGFSDGGAHIKCQTHGVYPTDLLIWMVRENGCITLEDAHYHLSYLPAFAAGLKDRGAIREGLAADIIVYDLQKLDVKPREIAHDVPPHDWRRVQRAEGYRYIMVNGQVTLENGRGTGTLPGKLLRHGTGT
jgi:N-acyl-D-amino-acid deacylase